MSKNTDMELHPHAKRILRAQAMHENIAASVPQLRRGLVWCTTCGREQKVDSAECLRSGWPKCHGQTMTIDSPDERALRRKL
jgi:Zn finger protein HypA/HybF involved in hydrogenase expression